MNWNSIVRSTSAFAVYMAVMAAYIVSPSPTAFALCLAAVLCLGLLVHSRDFAKPVSFDTHQVAQSVYPSLSESMVELHSLQNEINQLQAQFADESSSGLLPNSRDGLTG